MGALSGEEELRERVGSLERRLASFDREIVPALERLTQLVKTELAKDAFLEHRLRLARETLLNITPKDVHDGGAWMASDELTRVVELARYTLIAVGEQPSW